MPIKPACTATATEDTTAFRAKLASWFDHHGRDLPWRRAHAAYPVLVSELMLQQTQVSTVLAGGYFTKFLQTFPTLHALADADDEKLLKAWEGLGYYRRARLLREAARAVIERHGGEFPHELAALLALPGVGPYTAGALRAFAFNLPAVLVDGNIARVVARLVDLRVAVDAGAGHKAIWQAAEALACPARPRLHHSALMELGQRICRPGVPDCHACPVSAWCATPHPEMLPVKKERARITAVDELAVFLTDAGGNLLLHRESGKRRQGLWKLPSRPQADVAGLPVIERENYAITRYKVALAVHDARGAPAGLAAAPDEAWIPITEVQGLAMPSPYRRVLGRLLGFTEKSV